jgi:hypothetical protein
MRRAPTHLRAYLAAACLATICLAALVLAGRALARPTVRLRALPVPIPGFPHTGDILGAGTAAQAEYTIEGNEYFGSPPPIIGVNFYLPSGAKLHPQGFPTCTDSTLEEFGPISCPHGSAAGPIGKVIGFVTFGGERVEEQAELSSFYAPGGGMEFFTDGHSPVSLEILSGARYVNLDSAGGSGPELIAQVPLVASVPGAPYASVRSISLEVGSAYRSHGQTIYYGRVPSKCPKGGLLMKTEVILAEDGEASKPETVGASYTAPCPKRDT